jgi:RNA polymerase sigma factor (sigma-70 family)
MSPSVSVRLLLTQSDARLVGFARAGHERAFEALVQRYRRPLIGYCRRLLLSEERAEDTVQQALLQAWLALRSGTEVGDVKPWLYRIVHNAAVNMLRVSGYDYCKLSESLSGADAPQADLDRRIAVREALAGLAALPDRQREALLRTAVEGRSHQQVARELGLSENALRGLVYRARAALRAATGAIVPPPLISWALGAGGQGAPVVERIAEVGAGGGSAGLAGLLMKGGAVAVTASMLAGGIAGIHTRPTRAHALARARSASHGARRGGAPLARASTRETSLALTQPERRGALTGLAAPVHRSSWRGGRGAGPASTMPLVRAVALLPGSMPRTDGAGTHTGGHDGTSGEEASSSQGASASVDGGDTGHAQPSSDGVGSGVGDGGQSGEGASTSLQSGDSGSSSGGSSEAEESHDGQSSSGVSSSTTTSGSSKDGQSSSSETSGKD